VRDITTPTPSVFSSHWAMEGLGTRRIAQGVTACRNAHTVWLGREVSLLPLLFLSSSKFTYWRAHDER